MIAVLAVIESSMHVLMISLDTSLATSPDGDSAQRHLEYAARAGKLTIVTYTSRLPLREGQKGVIRSSPQLTIIPTNSPGRLTYAVDAYRLGSQIRPVDLITTQDPFVTGLVGVWLRRKLRAPLLVQNHSHYFGNPAWLNERPVRYRLFRLLGRWVLRRADMYRTVNQREREAYLAMGGAPERVAVLPVMTASEAFSAPVAARRRLALRERLGLRDDHQVILWVGRPIKTKRLPLLLQVFRRVAEQEPGAHLLLVGDMAQSPDDLPGLARRLGVAEKVVMAGPVARDELPVYYGLADVFAITSAYEGMPRVLGEAAAAGRAVVGMDGAAGVAEFIESGVNGCLCPDGDVECMASQILQLLRDQAFAARLGAAARDKALEHYNAARNAEAVVALWEKAVQMGMRR
jgi:glycosyltransferase involved in cell wall biosynthesis